MVSKVNKEFGKWGVNVNSPVNTLSGGEMFCFDVELGKSNLINVYQRRERRTVKLF